MRFLRWPRNVSIRPAARFWCTTTQGLSRLTPTRKRSEGETPPDCRSKVVVIDVRDAGAMRNGDGQTATHVRVRKSRKTVEALGEVMIRIERHLIKSSRTGTAETRRGRAGLRNSEVVLPLLIPGESDVGFPIDRRTSRPSTKSAPTFQNQDCCLRPRS